VYSYYYTSLATLSPSVQVDLCRRIQPSSTLLECSSTDCASRGLVEPAIVECCGPAGSGDVMRRTRNSSLSATPAVPPCVVPQSTGLFFFSRFTRFCDRDLYAGKGQTNLLHHPLTAVFGASDQSAELTRVAGRSTSDSMTPTPRQQRINCLLNHLMQQKLLLCHRTEPIPLLTFFIVISMLSRSS
jgi:hypothetical protein